MVPWDDERGQSLQIGAVLLFAALIIALSLYQAFVVPQQNEKVEFVHNQEVQDDLQTLRNAIVSTTGGGSTTAVSVQLGTRYPPRLIAVNPESPSGSLRTVATQDDTIDMAISGAKVVDDDEVDDLWNGTTIRYPTGAIVYRPNYNVYQRPPTTVYANSVLYNRFGTRTVPLSDQTFVRGNTISLIALNGSLGVTQTGALPVDVRPLSASTQTISVTNESGERITIAIPTMLSLSDWQSILERQRTGPDGHVADLDIQPIPGSDRFETLVMTLEGGENYTLQLTKVGVGSDVSKPGAKYLTDVAGDGVTVTEGATEQLVVEVRDRYNNPVSGVAVKASASQGTLGSGTAVGSSSTATATTNGDGQATFTFRKENVSGSSEISVTVNFTIGQEASPLSDANFEASRVEDANMTLTVENDVGATADPKPFRIRWQSPSTENPDSEVNDCTAEKCTWVVSGDTDGQLELPVQSSPAYEDVALDYAINDSSVAQLSTGTGVTDASGSDTLTLSARSEGWVSVVVSGGESSDVIEVLVEQLGLVYQGDATAVDGPSAPSPDNAGGVTFSLKNEYGQSVTVEEVTFDPADDTINAISDKQGGGSDDPQEVEIYAAASGGGTDGYIDYQLEDDEYAEVDPGGVTVDFDDASTTPNTLGGFASAISPETNPVIESGGTLEYSLFEFYRVDSCGGDDDGDGDGSCDEGETTNVDMNGKNMTVTVQFSVGNGPTQTREYTFTVGGSSNQAPTAEAGTYSDIDEGSSLTLDGTASSDPDGSISSYSWAVTSGPGSISGSGATVTYDAPDDVSSDQTVTVELTVTDDDGATDTDTATFTVRDTDTGSTQAYPSEYDDNSDAGAPQNNSIPPATAKGELLDFSVLRSDTDGQRARFLEVGQAGASGNDQQMQIGLAFRGLASGDHTLTLDYQIVNGGGESFELVVVDAAGNEIDTGTTYTLSSTTRTTTSFTLSTAESNYLDSTGEIYVVVRDNFRGNADSTRTSVYMDYIEITVSTPLAPPSSAAIRPPTDPIDSRETKREATVLAGESPDPTRPSTAPFPPAVVMAMPIVTSSERRPNGGRPSASASPAVASGPAVRTP